MPPQPRVLMIEDHPDIAELYQLKLQLDGYRVAVASNGITGLEMARSLMPDVILLDLHLPQKDGLELLTELRQHEATRDLLVVVFSEDDDPKIVQAAERLSVQAYLLKAQLLPSRLSRTIAEVLRNRGGLAVADGDSNGHATQQAS
jgi:two-component system, OmpR family, alkaline phosphatase synthesis response regulator PhoP